MLAALGGLRDSSDQWIFERKPDVIRVLAVRDRDSVTLVAPYAPPPVPSPPSGRASDRKDLSRTGTFGRSLGDAAVVGPMPGERRSKPGTTWMRASSGSSAHGDLTDPSCCSEPTDPHCGTAPRPSLTDPIRGVRN